VQAAAWLPAPLHLLPSMTQLDYLSWREKLGIARAMLALVRYRTRETATSLAIGPWLRERGQSSRAIVRFWQVVLVSALGEDLERASVAAARKVFVDGFLASRSGYRLYVPQAPLGEIYEQGIARWLRERGVQIHASTPVSVAAGARALQLAEGTTLPFDFIVIATGWKSLPAVVPRDRFPELAPLVDAAKSLASSPITSMHLWLDRPITSLPHAVAIDRLTQWVFAHGANYYQIVISASHDLASRERDDVLREVMGDLAAIFLAAKDAQVVRWRMLSQPDAVFSYRPGLDALRPSQRTPLETLFLAGDYTATGWPSTMESAVRSGNLAAEEIRQLARRLWM
jgi:squalene-associated FAD-dependent desaturase